MLVSGKVMPDVLQGIFATHFPCRFPKESAFGFPFVSDQEKNPLHRDGLAFLSIHITV